MAQAHGVCTRQTVRQHIFALELLNALEGATGHRVKFVKSVFFQINTTFRNNIHYNISISYHKNVELSTTFLYFFKKAIYKMKKSVYNILKDRVAIPISVDEEEKSAKQKAENRRLGL
jgi:hypothetical protein